MQRVNIVRDLSEAMSSLKNKRSKPAQRLKQKSKAMSIGPRAEKVRSISAAGRALFSSRTSKKTCKHKVRDNILKGDNAAMEDIIRKSHAEKLTADQRKVDIDHRTKIASHVSTDTTCGSILQW